MSALESSGRAVAAHTGLSAGELDADFVEAVARRVLQLVDDGFDRESQLLTVAQVAHRFQVHPSWVYSNATLLGVVRLGNGPRAPLRFDPARVAHVLRAERKEPTTPTTPLPAAPPVDRAPAPRPRRGLLPIAQD